MDDEAACGRPMAPARRGRAMGRARSQMPRIGGPALAPRSAYASVRSPTRLRDSICFMPVITSDLLVNIVDTLATKTIPLVNAKQIIAYCGANGIDVQGAGGRANLALWDADAEEGRGKHRLQKFKRGNRAQSPNAWCLTTSLPAGRAWAAAQGWHLVPWRKQQQKWDWTKLGPALTTSTHLP